MPKDNFSVNTDHQSHSLQVFYLMAMQRVTPRTTVSSDEMS